MSHSIYFKERSNIIPVARNGKDKSIKAPKRGISIMKKKKITNALMRKKFQGV